MKMLRTIATCLALLTGGCGSLKVQVDVLDPDYLQSTVSQARARDQLALVLSLDNEKLTTLFEAQRSAHDAFRRQVADSYSQIARALPDAQRTRAANLISAARANVDVGIESDRRILEEARKSLHARRDAIANAFYALPSDMQREILADRQRIPYAIVADLRAWQREANAIAAASRESLSVAARQFNANASALRTLAGSDTGGGVERQAQVDAASKEVASKEGAAQAADNAVATSMTGGKENDILSDSHAYAVVSAEDAKWAKAYNRTFGAGYLGNIDIAIKLERLGNFTIKGMSFDPSTVAQVAAKVTTQSVLFAAQIAGVPIRTSNVPATQPGAAIAQSSTVLAGTSDTIDLTNAAIDDYRAALLDIGLAITRERSRIEGTSDTDRKTAIDATKITFDNHKPRLDLSTLDSK